MGHDHDKGNDRFRRLVNEAEPYGPSLPFVHTTDVFQFREIAETGSLIPQECPVFEGEALTYFFYGRPAFRPNADEEATRLEHYLPVCLIFRPDAAIAIKRVYPFDSGAFEGGHYAAYLHRKMRLGDFAMEADPTTPARLVSRFYGSNDAYIRSSDPIDRDIGADDFEAQSYLGLASAKGGNAIDSRGSGVEIQTDHDVSIRDALEAVVLPVSFAESSTGQDLAAKGIHLLPYVTAGRAKPSEAIGAITQCCLTYFAHKNLLGKPV